jgi:heptosyltransferase-2
VTTDSGPRFFGIAFGRPVISLFGPTNAAWTRTHYDRETCLSHPLACSPCGQRECPLVHHDCMRLLDADRVYRHVLEQLDADRGAQAA